MLKYTPFFRVLDYIMDLDFLTDTELDFEDRLSVSQEFEGLRLTYHRIYKGKDSGEIFSFNLGHCDDEEIVKSASEGKSPIFNEMMNKRDSAESREKCILFSICKEKMDFIYAKIKSELRNKKELNAIKVHINQKSEKFLEVINSSYPGYFPQNWQEFKECQEVELAEILKEDQEAADHDSEYTIQMRFV